MQGFAATKLNEFAQGKISRRTLIETLTLAVTTMCAADANAAQVAAPRGVKAALVNHVSYRTVRITAPGGKAGAAPFRSLGIARPTAAAPNDPSTSRRLQAGTRSSFATNP